MTIKERYQRFKAWQRQPVHHAESHESHHCNNCCQDFTGHFCPTCGQKWNVGPVSWDSIRSLVLDKWGMFKSSFLLTVCQLLLRPGYLIGDYISGKKQTSFPPVSMLTIVALIIILAEKYLGIVMFGDGEVENPAEEAVDASANILFNKMFDSYDWGILLLFVFMSIPTYFVFRHAPRHPRHTWPQGFFIQVFNSSQFLVVALLCAFLRTIFGLRNIDSSFEVFVLIPLLFFYNYKQLFGYSFWGTLWRMVACWLLWLVCLGFTGEFFKAVYNVYNQGALSDSISHIVWALGMVAVFFVAVSFINAISLRNKKAPGNQKRWKIRNTILIILSAFLMCIFAWVSVGMVVNSATDHTDFPIQALSFTVPLMVLSGIFCWMQVNQRRKARKSKQNNKQSEDEKREVCLQDTEGDSQAGS